VIRVGYSRKIEGNTLKFPSRNVKVNVNGEVVEVIKYFNLNPKISSLI